MKCKKCRKKLIEGSNFCTYCGTEVEKNLDVKDTKQKEEKNVLNRKKKKLMLIVIIGIIILSVTLLIFLNNRKTIEEMQNSDNSKKETYVKNKIGLFKSEDIIDEKYNDKNDLIYCKYRSNNEVKENSFEYVYDKEGRVTKITYIDEKNYKSTLDIEYGEEGISRLISDYEISQSEYYVKDPQVILKYNTLHKTLGTKLAGKVEYAGAYVTYEKDIDGKKYKLIVEIDEDNKIQRKNIYEVDNLESSNNLSKFGILPLAYGNDNINIFKYPNLVVSYVGIGNVIVPITNPKNEIYSYTLKNDGTEESTEYIYDKSGKILFWGNQDEKFYSRYEKIDDKTYWKYNLADGGKYYQALNLEQQYCISKTKLFFNENNEIYKYEDYNTEYITKEEFENKENEYISYMEKNKIDSDNIINAFSNVVNLEDLKSYVIKDEEEVKSQSSINLNNNSNQVKSKSNNSTTENATEKTVNTINYISSSIGSNERDLVHSTLEGEFYISGSIDFTTNGDWDEEAEKFSVTVNDKKVKTRISEGTLVFEGIINLKEGKQNISIIANNPNGENKKESFTITNTPEKYEIPEYRRSKQTKNLGSFKTSEVFRLF